MRKKNLLCMAAGLLLAFGAVPHSNAAACAGKVGDRVWNDLNGNGIQDAGEPGIGGVTVILLDSTGKQVTTTTTTSGDPTGTGNGYYQFSVACPTDIVRVDETTLPKGSDGKIHFVLTNPNQGGNPATDSNPNPSPVTLNFSNNFNDQTVDFGYVAQHGAIGDYVWYDANGNGIQDAGESGMNGIVVNLYDSSGTNKLATATTAMGGPSANNGYYQFTGLDAGTYVVKVDTTTLPPNYVPTLTYVGSNTADSNPSPETVVLATDSSIDETIDFGYVSSCTGTIGDFIWHDANRNGLQDAGEVGIPGITVWLLDSGQNTIQTATTTGSGNYLFSGVCPGDYQVVVKESSLPPDFTATQPHVGGDTTIDSNGSPSPVTLTLNGNSATSDLTIDFGYVSKCNGAIGDFVWNDLNGNGIQDVGEPGIPNVGLNLFRASDHSPLASTTTDQNGHYQFTGYCPGDYTVELIPPSDYLYTTVGSSGSTPANDSNPNPSPVTLTVLNYNGDITQDLTIDFGLVVKPSATCLVINAVQGNPVSTGPMVGSGGAGGYTFSSSNLPAGLTMAADGSISGTPQVSGTFTYTVTVTDKNNNVGTVDCSVTITPPPSASCVDIVAVQGIPITPVKMTGSGGMGGPYHFSATGLPAGLNMADDGTVTGTPTQSGTFNYTVTVKDSAGNTGTLNCSVTVAPPVSATCVSITAVQGIAITPVTMVPSGGTGTGYTFTATGLPPGLAIDYNTGTISGTPTVSGNFNYTVTVKDSAGNTGSVNCSVTVAPPVSATCVSIVAVQGIPIAPVTMVASGGTGTGYTFTAIGLPAGLTIGLTTGTISGTPTVSGNFNYTVTVTDSAGNTGKVNCAVNVNPPVSATCISITAVQGIPITPVTMAGSGGVGPLYTFSATGLPDGLTMSASGTISGTPTVSGTFNYTVTITDGAGNVGTLNCSVTVAPAVSATCVNIVATQGVPITPVTMVGSGGAGGPYTFIVSGLPTGLIMSSTGTISGTPTVSGTFTYEVTVTDTAGNTGTVGCSVTVVPSGGVCKIGPSSMEGSLTIDVGDWISGGYSFTIPGAHPDVAVTLSNPTVTVPVSCTKGADPVGNIVINLPNASYVDAAGYSGWIPTGDANSILSWQGAVQAPDLCSGGPMYNSIGATFNTVVSDNNTTIGENFRFKYRDPAAKGKTNTNCTDPNAPNRDDAATCGASWSSTATCSGDSSVAAGDAAVIGFWQKQNGQNLILTVNGGLISSQSLTSSGPFALGNWLASNFPYLYGPKSQNDLTNKSNTAVASFFLTLSNAKGQKTYAQIMASALSSYVTNKTLAGGNYASTYGFNVSLASMSGHTYNVGTYGTAIGLVNNKSYPVLYLLQQANLALQNGTFNATAFNNIFTGINQTGNIK